ncbi:MAG: YARHG domain-containing protein [Bacteroidales bacterium]|nr:YARHG domain-containing protein [Bacteroidales bacterium]
MKHRIFILAVLATFMLAGTVSAQVPSIPRKTTTAKHTTATTQRNPNVAWGTQYDWLSTRYATYDDIRNYDSGQIRVLKNSIYARHGRRFKDANLRKYFNSQPWYNPRYDEVPAKQFNKYENANIAFLKKYEK